MTYRTFSILFLALIISANALAQDSLLLTNGKIKNLKGIVSYFDNDIVQYQNAKQQEKMNAFLEKKTLKQEALEASETWLRKQEKLKERNLAKIRRGEQRIKEIRAKFESDSIKRSNSLPAADFERWLNSGRQQLKELRAGQEILNTLTLQTEELKASRAEAKIRRRFSKQVARDNVFSILRADGSEDIVYSADTLGFLMDGTTDVEYNLAEMRLYIKGRQDGRKHSFHDVGIGLAVGLVSGLVFTYTLDMFYAPIPPAICVAVMAGLRKVRPNPKLELTANLLESDPYMDGYYRSAKGRKILAFTIGAVGGLGIGITAGVLTSPLLQN